MILCPNCSVRFKRDLFKECPGCGFVDMVHLINQMEWPTKWWLRMKGAID